MEDKRRELLLAATMVAIIEGKSAQIIYAILESEGLTKQEITELIEIANSGAQEGLKKQNVFITGDTDENGFLRWQQPQSLLCSDDLCPCTDKAQLVIGKTAYLFISDNVVSYRKDFLTLLDLQVKLWNDAEILKSALVVTQGVINPIVICKRGAIERHLDLETASQDAKKWYETGLAPLRATPLTQKPYKTEISKPWWKVW